MDMNQPGKALELILVYLSTAKLLFALIAGGARYKEEMQAAACITN